VKYKGEVVGEYVVDVLVEGKIIIELKAIEQLQKIHEAQLLNYLKATGIKVGLLVNFKYPRAEIKRMVLDLPEGPDIYCGDKPAPCNAEPITLGSSPQLSALAPLNLKAIQLG
jgi:hypothetical protein